MAKGLMLIVAVVAYTGAAHAQPCQAVLNELNYDCALADGLNDDACESVELSFTGTVTQGVTLVTDCGVSAIAFTNGSCTVKAESGVTLPDVVIPANGLYLIGKAGVPNVDLETGWGPHAIVNSGGWVHLVSSVSADNRWYGYERTSSSTDCFAQAGGEGVSVLIGKDQDNNLQADGGLPPGPPVAREESISLCQGVYIADNQAENLTGPAATPGEPNACDSMLPWDSLADAGPPEDVALHDTAPGPDHYVAPDTATPDGGQPDLSIADTAVADAASADVASADVGRPCNGLDFIGECHGTVLHWCNDDEYKTYDCIQEDKTCGLVDCIQESCYGHDCVAALGEACYGNTEGPSCNVLDNHGCIGGVCAPSESCDRLDYVENCSGTFRYYCYNNMVWGEDCSLGGIENYICGNNSSSEPACLGQYGAFCGPPSDFECAPGYSCEQGSCMPMAGVDAGLPDASGADPGVPADAAGADRVAVDTRSGGDVAAPDATSPDVTGTDRLQADSRVSLDAGAGDAASLDAIQTGDASLPDRDFRIVMDVALGQDVGEINPGDGCQCSHSTPPSGLAVSLLVVLGLLARRRVQ